VNSYFDLQYRLINRKINDAGMPPWVGYLLMSTLFVGMSMYLFYKLEYAEIVYLIVAISMIFRLSDDKRNEFLTLCYPSEQVRSIRIAENLLLASPFALFLMYRLCYSYILVLVILAFLLVFITVRKKSFLTIPTPFAKHPFEFTMGFRQNFYMIFGAYILSFIAVSVDNFNLGIFSLLLLFALFMSYYAYLENDYFVWSHADTPTQFIVGKIKKSITYSTLLAIPIMTVLMYFFFENIITLLVFLVIGYAFLVFMIVSKYAHYPSELSIIQGILLSLCIVFPPLLVVLIPFLFKKSLKQLSNILT
jgi:hypothetical protein